MKNREQLNEIAAKVRTTMGIKGENSIVLKANADNLFAGFIKFVEEGHTDEEITMAARPVKDAISLYNDQMRVERLEALQPLKYQDAMAEYLRTQCVDGLALKNDKKAGWGIVEDKNVELSAWDFVNYLCPGEIRGIVDACTIWMDNVAKVHFNDTEKSVTNRKGLSIAYIAMRSRMGWEITDIAKTGKGTLVKQLNELVARIFRIDLKMIKADLKFIEDSIFTTKSKANEAGTFVMRNEETLVNFMFRALYTRFNNLPYNWQSGSNEGNEPKSVEANDAMAEAPAKKQEEPVVTAESVGKAPAAKKHTIKAPSAPEKK